MKNRGLAKMLYGGDDDGAEGNLEKDPYVEDEPDPAKCRAAESSLWEVVALKNHVLPQVHFHLNAGFGLDRVWMSLVHRFLDLDLELVG